MAKIIAANLCENLLLCNPVRQITQEGRSVTVSSENVSVHARRVIVATGTAMANFIRFDPVLPPARALLQQRMPQGEVWKIWLCYDKAWWRSKKLGLNGETISIYGKDFIANSRDGIVGLRTGSRLLRRQDLGGSGKKNKKKAVNAVSARGHKTGR